jgi:acyl-CoA dehydrogenase
MDPDTFDGVIRSIREFVRSEVVPRELEIEETDAIPDDLRKSAVDLGLFGYALPEEFGGLSPTMSEEVRIAFELGYTSPAFRSMFGTNNGIAGQMIVGFGRPEQQTEYLPRLASGAIASFCLTESEAGSDPTQMRSTARKDGDSWIINGTKRFITNAQLASFFVVFARSDPDSTGATGISAFIVDADAPGLQIGPKDDKMGQRGAWTSEVVFDDVRVSGERLLGAAVGSGFSAAMSVLARGRLYIAALCVGLATRICEETRRHAVSSKSGGHPIGQYQLIQAMLAESHAEVLAARAMVIEVARRYDVQEDRMTGPSAAKLFASEMVNRVADRGVQVHGGLGYMRSTAVERFYRDSRLYRIYEGTSEIQKLVIGRALVRTRGDYPW